MRYAKIDSGLTRDSTALSDFSSHVIWCKFKYYSYCTQLYIFIGLDCVQLADGRTRIAEFSARLAQFAVRRIRIAGS